MFPLTIHLPVGDVAAAEAFYRRVFWVEPLAPGELRLGEFVVLHLCDEATHVPTAAEDGHRKGHSPVVELRVREIDPWLERVAREGGTVRSTSRSGDAPTGPIIYAEIIDPFGHLWSFLRDEQNGHVFG